MSDPSVSQSVPPMADASEAEPSPEKLEVMKGRFGTDLFRPVEETAIHQGAVVAFHEVEIADEAGNRFARDVIRHPGAVSVVPFDGTNVTLVRQYRAAIDGELYEIPAGKRDVDGEPPEVTAERELAEEVGLEAETIELLVNMHHSPGFCDEYGFIYLAQGLTQVEDSREGPEEQAMTLHSMPLEDAVAWCFDGRITDSKTMTGIFALYVQLQRQA